MMMINRLRLYSAILLKLSCPWINPLTPIVAIWVQLYEADVICNFWHPGINGCWSVAQCEDRAVYFSQLWLVITMLYRVVCVTTAWNRSTRRGSSWFPSCRHNSEVSRHVKVCRNATTGRWLAGYRSACLACVCQSLFARGRARRSSAVCCVHGLQSSSTNRETRLRVDSRRIQDGVHTSADLSHTGWYTL